MRVLVLGLAFKEDCPDLRNTRVVDVIDELRDFGAAVDVHDPEASAGEARTEYGIDLVDAPEIGAYDGVILAVPHRKFVAQGAATLRSYGRPGAHVFYDLKSAFAQEESDLRL
jgi:UDP-N-acetyl-D-galactosamine dehydrogenase